MELQPTLIYLAFRLGHSFVQLLRTSSTMIFGSWQGYKEELVVYNRHRQYVLVVAGGGLALSCHFLVVVLPSGFSTRKVIGRDALALFIIGVFLLACLSCRC